MAERDPSAFARMGAKALNAGRTPEQRKRFSRHANKARWQGHVKKSKTCACKFCVSKKKRASIKNKK